MLSMGVIKTCHALRCRIISGCLVHGVEFPSIDDEIPGPGTYFPVFVSQAETDIQSNINTFSKTTAFRPMQTICGDAAMHMAISIPEHMLVGLVEAILHVVWV